MQNPIDYQAFTDAEPIKGERSAPRLEDTAWPYRRAEACASAGAAQAADENETRKPFEITDDGLAEWAMRKIAEARSDTAKWMEHFADQLQRIRKANEETEAFFTAALARYFDTVPLRATKTQSKYTLPSGELVRKAQPPEFIRDDAQLVPFLQENDLSEYVKQKPSADWGALKRACTVLDNGAVVEESTGMVLPGVTAVMRPEKFEVKINGN